MEELRKRSKKKSFGRDNDILKSNGSTIIPKSNSIQKLGIFLDIIWRKIEERFPELQYKDSNSSPKEA